MPRLVLIGINQPTHVGRHLFRAACSLGWDVEVRDIGPAYDVPRWVRRVFWHLLGKRPPKLRAYSRSVLQHCLSFRPDLVLGTGIVPVAAPELLCLRQTGIPVANFLVDDPWNRAHRAPWFMQALPNYAHVFTPRHANEADLRALRGPTVSWLPFAYAPEDHHPPQAVSEEDRRRWGHLVAFIGGADRDRVAAVRALIQAGVPVGLWGGYWKEHPDLAPHAHGHADEEQCRRIVASAGANLCLVRRANRDGHSMRSYELPAMGGCLVVEDTEDHRRLFGTPGAAVFIRLDSPDWPLKVRELLQVPEDVRAGMRLSTTRAVAHAANTYASRLVAMQEKIVHEHPA